MTINCVSQSKNFMVERATPLQNGSTDSDKQPPISPFLVVYIYFDVKQRLQVETVHKFAFEF